MRDQLESGSYAGLFDCDTELCHRRRGFNLRITVTSIRLSGSNGRASHARGDWSQLSIQGQVVAETLA